MTIIPIVGAIIKGNIDSNELQDILNQIAKGSD